MAVSDLSKIARLTIDIQPKILGITGIAELDRFLKSADAGNKRQVSSARILADTQIREARRASNAVLAENMRLQRSNEQLQVAQTRLDEAAASGRIGAYRRATLEVERLNARIMASNDAVARAQMNAVLGNRSAAAAQAAVATADRNAALRVGAGAVASGLIGAGGLGILAGGLTIRSAANWQTFSSQTQANSPVSPLTFASFQRLALQRSTQTGANPTDILTALRYGSELGMSPTMDRRSLQAALMLGLPTGGSAAVAPSQMSIGTVMRNFPGMQNPQSIASMILAASQNSAGVTAPQFVEAMPRLLNIAGHIGTSDQLQQSLAIVAALTSAGMPLADAQVQATNMITKVFKPAPSTLKYITSLDKQYGLNIASDFGPQALQQKGLAGIIGDLHNANLGPATLAHLFPNMRGYFGALGLTGNQNASFLKILGNVNASPGSGNLNTNMDRYLKLSSTEAQKLQQQLHLLAITTGTDLLPAFNSLLKDAIVPAVTDISSFVHNNKDLVDTFIKLSPLLLGMGVGIKGLLILSRIVPMVTEFGTALGIVGVKGAISSELSLTAIGMQTVGTSAATAAPEVGAAAASMTALDASIAGGAAAGGAGGLLGTLAKLKGFIAANGGLLAGLGLAFGAQKVGTDLLGPLNKRLEQQYLKNNPGSPGYAGRQAAAAQALKNGPPSGWHLTQQAFGMPSGSFYSGDLGPTHAGIWTGSASGGQWANDPAAFHWDLGTLGAKDKYHLPGGGNAQYKVVGRRPDVMYPGTWDVTVQSPNGGLATMMHVSQAPALGAAFNGMQGFGVTGADHLHIGGDQKFLNYLYAGQNIGNTRVQATASGLNMKNLPSNIARYGGSIMGAAQKYGLPPALLASIMMNESGAGANNYSAVSPAGALGLMQIMPGNLKSAGVSNWKDSRQNIFGGAKLFSQILNGPAGGNMTLALEMYNAGPNASSSLLSSGAVSSYANSVIGLAGTYGGMNRAGRAQVNYGGAGAGAAKPAVGDLQNAFTMLTHAYRNPDGSINFRRMPPAQRLAADNILRLLGNANLDTLGNTLNTDVGQGILPKGVADQIYRTASGKNAPTQSDPERAFNQAHAAKAKSPAQWSTYWAGKATHDKKALADILGQYTDPLTGKVNFAAMPPAVRKAADAAIRSVDFDTYMATRGTLNADISNAAVRGPLMGAAWKHYMSQSLNPEASYGSAKAGLGATAGASAWHIIGKNCEAASHALPVHRKIEVNTHKTAVHAASQLKVLEHIHTEMVTQTGILKRLAGGGGAAPAPRMQGISTQRPPHR